MTLLSHAEREAMRKAAAAARKKTPQPFAGAIAELRAKYRAAAKANAVDADRVPSGLTDSAALAGVVWPYAWGVARPAAGPES